MTTANQPATPAPTFGPIREKALERWNTELVRTRMPDLDSDDYTGSSLCNWQNECLDNGKHLSVICSLGDWMDNVSDLLYDKRYDEKTAEDDIVLFRFYTKCLLFISEILEDFVTLNKAVTGVARKALSSRHLESGILGDKELTHISEFINSVCKHKLENNNLHVHNHHLKYEFVDFGAINENNQIRLDQQNWAAMNQDTSILMPSLLYFINVVCRLYHQLDHFIKNEPGYKDNLIARYADDWKAKEEA